jgi:hypothetical protein
MDVPQLTAYAPVKFVDDGPLIGPGTPGGLVSVPEQTLPPLHTSDDVQASPSLHAVPAV